MKSVLVQALDAAISKAVHIRKIVIMVAQKVMTNIFLIVVNINLRLKTPKIDETRLKELSVTIIFSPLYLFSILLQK